MWIVNDGDNLLALNDDVWYNYLWASTGTRVLVLIGWIFLLIHFDNNEKHTNGQLYFFFCIYMEFNKRYVF